MNATFKGIKARLDVLEPRVQVCFGFLCSERLHNCCWSFQKQYLDFDISAYFRGCKLVEQWIQGQSMAAHIEQLIPQIESTVPNSDEFGGPLAVQAQSGMLALLYTSQACLGAGRIDSAAGAVVDALDNYDYFIRDQLQQPIINPNDYPLLQRELQWQNEQLDMLVQLADWSSALAALRFLNRQFMVPAAV